MSADRATPDFAIQTAAAKKILMIEVAGLGDLVHSLPAMRAVRQRYPHAELHCLVRHQNASLLRLTPWIDRVWPYRRGEATSLCDRVHTAQTLRAQHFDVAIDLTGSDVACLLAWISGATRRLVRRPGGIKRRRGWRWFSTDVMEHPFGREPMYLQRWKCLQYAGFGSSVPKFEVIRDASVALFPGASPSRRGYIHLSPYTKLSRKELPPAQMAQLVLQLHEALPHLHLVISCSGQSRERRALDELLDALPFAPWKVFAGTLDIPQLYALIEGSALHLSGDTGSIHLAWLAGTPSVSWFSALGNHLSWVPRGEQHAVVYSTTPTLDYLHGIDTDAVIIRALELASLPIDSWAPPERRESLSA